MFGQGSVEVQSKFGKLAVETQKAVKNLGLTGAAGSTKPCLENPRVGGSIPPQATKFKPQPLSVGVFSYVLPPDPANTRGTLSRFGDFGSPLGCLPLATWRSLRAIPLSFLSGSNLPEVRRRHAGGLVKSTGYPLIDQAVVFRHW
jgi:hypothetical protein